MAYDSKGTINKVIIVGRLGQDPELTYTPSGTAVLTLSVATNTSYKGQDGNTVENTEWNRVVLWRKLAEIIAQYAKKGSLVYVEGKLQTRSWDDQDGNKRYTTEIWAEHCQLLGKNEQVNEQTSQAAPQTNQSPESEPDDDLPF